MTYPALSLAVLCSLPVLAAPADPCAAAAHDPITAGDLAALLPAFGLLPPDAPIAPAPAPGARRVLRSFELRSLARSYSLDLASPEDLCFEWPMEPLDRDRLLEAMRSALPYPETHIEILNTSLQPVPRGRIEFRREDLGTPAAGLRAPAIWRGNVVYGANGRFSIWARVLVSARLPRIVAVETLRRGKPIAPADVRVEYSESFPVPGDLTAGIDQVSGRIPARTIAAGSEIHLSQLLAAADINRGDLVEVEVRSGSTRLAFAARSESQGRSGEHIALRNLSSNRVFQARVDGRGKASVDAGAVPGN
jgi:flagella basal body P-ring formation protein FlgA